VLNGTSELFAVNLAGATQPAGAQITLIIVWTEE
jgi:hypothetical protein